MATLLDRLASELKFAARRGDQSPSLVSPWMKSVVWNISRQFLSLSREGYGQNSVVYSCLRLLTQSVAEAPLIAVSTTNDQQRTPLPYDHELCQLLREPNPHMTEYEFVEMILLHLSIVGRSHWYKRRDNARRVIELWPLRPDRVGPIYADGTSTDPVLDGWSYLPPGTGEAIRFEADDLITFNLPDPAGESGGIIEGLGPLMVLSREVETDNEATTYVGSLLKNYATPGLVIKLAKGGYSPDKAKAIKRIFRGEFGGIRRGEPAVLDDGADITQLGFDLGQLEFPNLRHVAEARIAAAFGVPAILVGLNVGLNAGIRATIQDQRKFFTETTLSTYWRRIGDQLTNDLAHEWSDAFVVAFDLTKVKALIEQSRYELEPLKEAFSLGAATVDEYRDQVLHLPALPNGAGKVLYIPSAVQVVPQEMIAESYTLGLEAQMRMLEGGDTSEPDPADQSAEDDIAAGDGDSGDDPAAAKSLALKGKAGVPHPHKGHTGPHPGAQGKPHPHVGAHVPHPGARGKPHPHTGHSLHAARVQSAADKHAENLRAQLEAQLTQIQHQIEQLSTSGKSAGAIKLGTSTAHALVSTDPNRLEGAIKNLWTDAISQAYRDAGEEVGTAIPFSYTSGSGAALLAKVPERAAMIEQTTRDAMDALVARADAEGWTFRKLRDEAATLPAFSAARAQTIARTEGSVASALAAVSAYRDSAQVASVSVEDGDQDPGCAAANGAVWSLDEAEENPSEHPNCTRSFSAIVADLPTAA